MPDYLLDTNILDYWYNPARREHQNVLARVELVRRPDAGSGYVSRLFTSVVTLGEMEYGHRAVLSPDVAQQRAFARFVHKQYPEALEVTAHVAEQYGELKAWLFNNCSPNARRSKARRVEELVEPTSARELGIQENDVWIAAQALTHNLTLVTHDSRGSFGRLLTAYRHTLRVEDWTHME